MKEITYDELRKLPKDTYELIDIRDDGLTAYGMIPGAVHIYVKDLESSVPVTLQIPALRAMRMVRLQAKGLKQRN